MQPTSGIPLDETLDVLFAFKLLRDLENNDSVRREGWTERTMSLAW